VKVIPIGAIGVLEIVKNNKGSGSLTLAIILIVILVATILLMLLVEGDKK